MAKTWATKCCSGTYKNNYQLCCGIKASKVCIMEKTRIGLNAGKVWRILNEKGELSMFDLCRELGLTFEDVALAIGWLARESKVFLRKREGMLFASIENVEFTFG